jgi:2-phosphoglycerate kinase
LICKRYLNPTTELESSDVHNAIQTVLHEDDILDGPPPNSAIVSKHVNKFNRELLKITCQIMGCKQIHGHLIAEQLFEELNLFLSKHRKEGKKMTDRLSMKKSTFEQILKHIFLKYEYDNPQCINDFHNATQLVDHRTNLIILLGGSSGTGKSTLASLVASRLGISTVLSTDSIRHIMRNFMSREENPILFCSTYETAKFVPVDPDNPLPEKKRLLAGFQQQCQYVHPHLMNVIDKLVGQNDNVVIEGVHLTVDFLTSVMKKYPFCIPFVVHIKNKEKHKERFAVRSKHMTLEPRYNKYIGSFDNIRAIHKYFVKKAEKRLIPRVDNSNVDKSLGIIHSTIIRCLRKISKSESLMDEETNKATILCQEFNVVTKSGLSSAEAQKVIKSKVNKGEIFKRFFADQNEMVSPDQPMKNMSEIKRVHSFDENEIGQMRKESEGNKNLSEGVESDFDPLHRLTSEMKNESGNDHEQPLNSNVIPEGTINDGSTNIDTPGNVEKEEVKKVLKASKSSENLLEKTKKHKKEKIASHFALRILKKDDLDLCTLDEDKQSLMSGLCSVYSGSIDVANYIKTEDVGSHSAGESEGSDEDEKDEKDIDSAAGDKISK